jgi:hypothetical protein
MLDGSEYPPCNEPLAAVDDAVVELADGADDTCCCCQGGYAGGPTGGMPPITGGGGIQPGCGPCEAPIGGGTGRSPEIQNTSKYGTKQSATSN